uniref:Tyrosine-protein kinase n=1 Tax=Electrophorus electricus TaxID=8005 RepID=A0A4W4EEQ5_ELEEL
MSTSEIVKEGILLKMSQQKKKISPKNYRERLFTLTSHMLTYYEQEKGTKKGTILSERIAFVEKVDPEENAPVHRQFPFQVSLLTTTHPYTQQCVCLVTVIKGNPKLSAKYHKGFWDDGKFLCCGQTVKNAPGCIQCSLPSNQEGVHLPPIPETDPRSALALYDYTAERPEELSLLKGHRYVPLEKISQDWWRVRDMDGYGFTKYHCLSASTVVKCVKCVSSFCVLLVWSCPSWYVGSLSRGKTEQLLREKGKEGSFVVRDSSQKGMYTVSLPTFINEGKYFLAEKHLFSSIPSMIDYHQHNGAGLLTRLRHPANESAMSPPAAQGEWELRRDDVRLGKELGSGQFGVVQLGVWKEQQQVAIKMMKEGCMSSEDFKEEAQVMMKLQHPKLVKLYGVCTDCFPIYIVTEFMSNGCLLDYLRRRGKEARASTLLHMCVDVCEAMAYLEDQQFIHRDLVRTHTQTHAPLKVYVLDDQYTSSAGTKFPVKWSAPEVLYYTRFSTKSDVWAFGVLMWEVYSLGKQPYEQYDNIHIAEKLMQGHRLYRPQQATESIYRVMKACWHEVAVLHPAPNPDLCLSVYVSVCLSLSLTTFSFLFLNYKHFEIAIMQGIVKTPAPNVHV